MQRSQAVRARGAYIPFTEQLRSSVSTIQPWQDPCDRPRCHPARPRARHARGRERRRHRDRRRGLRRSAVPEPQVRATSSTSAPPPDRSAGLQFAQVPLSPHVRGTVRRAHAAADLWLLRRRSRGLGRLVRPRRPGSRRPLCGCRRAVRRRLRSGDTKEPERRVGAKSAGSAFSGSRSSNTLGRDHQRTGGLRARYRQFAPIASGCTVADDGGLGPARPRADRIEHGRGDGQPVQERMRRKIGDEPLARGPRPGADHRCHRRVRGATRPRSSVTSS